MKFQFQKRNYLVTNKANKHEKKYQSHLTLTRKVGLETTAKTLLIITSQIQGQALTNRQLKNHKQISLKLTTHFLSATVVLTPQGTKKSGNYISFLTIFLRVKFLKNFHLV